MKLRPVPTSLRWIGLAAWLVGFGSQALILRSSFSWWSLCIAAVSSGLLVAVIVILLGQVWPPQAKARDHA